jgi:ribose transport system substrate-binding protein
VAIQRHHRRARTAALAGLIALASAVGACSSSSTSTPAASSTGSASSASQVSSGAIPSWVPKSVASIYPGYQYFSKLQHDPYASYKPPKPPWTFCYNTTYLGNAFQEGVVAELTKLNSEYVKAGLAKGSLTVTNSNNSTVEQISQLNAIASKCSVIFSFPGSPTALCSAIASANAKGDLYVSIESPVYCPNAMNVTWNGYWAEYVGDEALLKAMNYQGNLVITTGIPGVAIGTAETYANDNALKGHPNVHVLGSVDGEWTPSVAHTAMASFLATHPQTVNGVIDAGAEDVAAEQALIDAGRPVAKINSITGECSILALWKKYPQAMTLATNQDPGAAAYESFLVAEKMLAGQKPVINTIFYPVPTITAANFSSWYKPSMTIQSGCIPRSPGGRAVADSYFNAYFSGASQPKLMATP